MATFFHDDIPSIITIIPPNSEVGQDWQRLGNKPRSVGSFYMSNRGEDVQAFLYDFYGNYTIDLLTSYYLCAEFFEALISNCNGYYADGLTNLSQTINYIKALIAERKESDLLFSASLSLTDSKKYMRIDNVNDTRISLFKKMLLGDITEIVIKKVTGNSFTIYVRPRKGVIHYVADHQLFGQWLSENI